MLFIGILSFSLLTFSNSLSADNVEECLIKLIRSDGSSPSRTGCKTCSTTSIYEKLKKKIETEASFFEKFHGNCDFSDASPADLATFYPSEFFYFSPRTLIPINDSELAVFFRSHENDVSLITKIFESGKSHKNYHNFLFTLRGNNPFTLAIIKNLAQDVIRIAKDFDNAMELLLQLPYIAFYAPPYFFFKAAKINRIHMIHFLAFKSKSISKDFNWIDLPRMTRKTWARLVFEGWSASLIDESDLSQFSFLFQDLTLSELEKIPITSLENINDWLKSIEGNTVQIRKWLDRTKNVELWSLIPETFLPHMLPVQIQKIENNAILVEMLSKLRKNDYVPFPAASQLLTYLLRSNDRISALENYQMLVGKLLFSQSNVILSQKCNETLTMNASRYLNSPQFTFLEAYHILGKFEITKEKEKLFNMGELLVGIPASVFVNYEETFCGKFCEVYLNLFLNSAPPSQENTIRTAVLLELYQKLGYKGYLQSALEKNQNDLISLVSPYEIYSNADNILQILQSIKNDERIVDLPNYVLTELLRASGDKLLYENIFNSSHPIHLAIIGLNCDILSTISVVDFMPIIDHYNKVRKTFYKEFPKDIQKCVQTMFMKYLREKTTVQFENEGNIYRVLDLADIRAIGGYILATVPFNVIAMSKYYEEIFQEIGSLSLPELMFAVPQGHLSSLVSGYINQITKNQTICVEHLFLLGNLTHFMNDDDLKKVDPKALKFLLESGSLDTRICANSSTRTVWTEILIDAFGPAEKWKEDDLLLMADMLIVFNNSELMDKTSKSVRTNVADLMKSRYNERIAWWREDLSFYQVCSSEFLKDENEIKTYTLSIGNLAKFYAVSIQNLLETISPAKEIDCSEIYGQNLSPSTSTYSSSNSQEILETTKPLRSDSARNSHSEELLNSDSRTELDSENKTFKSNFVDTTDRMNELLTVAQNVVQTSIVNRYEITNSDVGPIVYSVKTDVTNATGFTYDMATLQFTHITDTTFTSFASLDDATDKLQTSPQTILNSNSMSTSTHSIYEVGEETSTILEAVEHDTEPVTETILSPVATAVAVSEASESQESSLNVNSNSTTTTFSMPLSHAAISVKERDLRSVMNSSNEPTRLIVYEGNKDEYLQSLLDSIKPGIKKKREVDSAATVQINCNVLKMLGPLSQFLFPHLKLTDDDYYNCIELLGALKLNRETKTKIWSVIKRKISIPNLRFVADEVLTEISIEDFQQFNFSIRADWGLEILFKLSRLSTRLQNINEEMIVEKFLKENESFQTSLPSSVVLALGKLFCQLPNQALKKLTDEQKIYLDIWKAFDTIEDCNKNCLKEFAESASDFFGNPSFWKPAIFTMLGPVSAGLNVPEWTLEMIKHLPPSAIRCLPNKLNITDYSEMPLRSIFTLRRETIPSVLLHEDDFVERVDDRGVGGKMNSAAKFLKSSFILLLCLISSYFV